MEIELREESFSQISDYSCISIQFSVDRILTLNEQVNPLTGFTFIEQSLPVPYVKDYDAIPGNHPTEWSKKFDVTNWGMLSAYCSERRVGGAIIAYNTNSVHLLEERSDLAVLWDIRIHEDFRGQGVGTQLFTAAIGWAKQRNCRWLKIETQNINVPACKFYAKQGCILGAIHRLAYPEFPEEIQLLWYKAIT